ncbi:hypothetical protein ACIBI0_35510 [Microbispora rosea]|uniref:hypothetical protein n=1 Tax=Microbispora TaxID=2005 RepID=UPI0014736106|nr:hypothetical protein [Microbispora sp. H10836]
MTVTPDSLRKRLEACPAGREGWREFEDAALATLRFLFVPPLSEPIEQARSYSGIDRRDAVFPNRNLDTSNHWGHLLQELNARMVLVEFKNYKDEEIGKEEVNQTRNYLNRPMGRLALIVSNKKPNDAAHIKRNTIYSEDGKVILFITVEHLIEMLYMKERGEDPADLIMDSVERFYLQYE